MMSGDRSDVRGLHNNASYSNKQRCGNGGVSREALKGRDASGRSVSIERFTDNSFRDNAFQVKRFDIPGGCMNVTTLSKGVLRLGP
jgi:hypothetical protein